MLVAGLAGLAGLLVLLKALRHLCVMCQGLASALLVCQEAAQGWPNEQRELIKAGCSKPLITLLADS